MDWRTSSPNAEDDQRGDRRIYAAETLLHRAMLYASDAQIDLILASKYFTDSLLWSCYGTGKGSQMLVEKASVAMQGSPDCYTQLCSAPDAGIDFEELINIVKGRWSSESAPEGRWEGIIVPLTALFTVEFFSIIMLADLENHRQFNIELINGLKNK